MKQDAQMEALLSCGNIIRGYVYKDGKRSEQWFEGTPENIASFLTQRGDADHMVLTDMMDMLVLDTIGRWKQSSAANYCKATYFPAVPSP